ncbi:MAG: TonB-dependent receptor, partial [Acidobacteriota bacterium]|nr:TonB-dependent receptor [Acidobacteriota bacterium]
LPGSSTAIVVTSDVPVIEAARTQLGETILPREIDNLPLNGRNFLDLALLAPGVSRTNTGSNERFAETSAVPGTGISIAGQRNLNTGFVVDGLSANDDAADLTGTFYSQEVIREFQVITSGGIAEFGRASGGVVNILTKSGTNQFHGRLYDFTRNRRFDARNPLLTRKDPLTQTQYGASVGGPALRDRTFLFGNFEQTRLHRAGVITIAPANVAAVNSALDRFGYGGARIATGEFPTGLGTTNYFAKLDHRLNTSQNVAARYSLYDVTSTNARNVGGLGALSRGTGLENRDRTIALSHVYTVSSTEVNEARFQWTRSRLAAPVNDLAGPAINISGVANLGTATFSPTARSLGVFEFSEALAISRGAHFFKAGGDYLLNRVDIQFPGALQGVYTFSSLANFQAGRYVTFQQAFGAPGQFQSNPNLGFFIQDEWRVRGDLTLNLGLRYDVQKLPSPVQVDPRDVAPRVGIAWSPGDRKTVIRSSFGLFYDRVALRATSNAFQRDGSKYRISVLPFGDPAAPAFPGVLPAFPAGLLASVTTIDPKIRNGYSMQASLQVERQIGSGTSFSVGYQHLRGTHILMSRNINVPTVSADDAARLGIPNLGRPDSRVANVSQYQSSGDSYFDGMTISINRRQTHWAGFRLSYTLSKSIDDAGNAFFSTPQNNFDLRDDRGLSLNDQRHRLSLSGVLQSPNKRLMRGFELSSILNYASALPFNLQTGTDRNNDTNVNDRPEGVGRNTGVGFPFASLDMRLARMFHPRERVTVEGLAEAFNVFNHANLQLPNGNFGPGRKPAAGFGAATAAADPRQLQLGLRVSW